MARHLFFAIALMGIGVLNSPATAVKDAAQCEDQSSNCVGRCANPGGGEYDNNRCMRYCERQVNRCLIRAHDAARRW
jgi:hypothetical protein